MHKYRAAAKQAAWYSERDDPQPNYNPFRKIRSYEDDLPTLHRALPLHFSTSPLAAQSDEDAPTDEKSALPNIEEDPQASQNVFYSPEHVTSTHHATESHNFHDTEQGVTRSPRAFAPWKSWSQQKLSHVWRQIVLASGSRSSGDVKRSVADMGMSVISHAPLGTKGTPFFQLPGRRSRFMVIEYAKQEGNITRSPQGSADILRNSTRSAVGVAAGVGAGVPLLRFYEKVSARDGDKHIIDNHQTNPNVESLCAELFDHLSSVSDLLRSQRGIDYSPTKASVFNRPTRSQNHVRYPQSRLSLMLIKSQIHSR